MRIMKRSHTLTSSALLSEVFAQLPLFSPSPTFCKKRIEDLIERVRRARAGCPERRLRARRPALTCRPPLSTSPVQGYLTRDSASSFSYVA